MSTMMKCCPLWIVALLILSSNSVAAQDDTYMTEAGIRVKKTPQQKPCKKPRDSFYDRYLHTEKMPLPYDHIHEKDVFWEKRIWRELDTREKMNHSFTNPKAPLISILMDAANAGDITLYSTWDDEFSTALTQMEVENLMAKTDTVTIFDPETLEETLTVVKNELDPADIKKYRIKEVWFFDEETSSMGVRILGIAPIISRYDEKGQFLNEGPLFWAYYPELRPTFARHEVFNPMNDAARLSWDDLFEARMFASYIVKEGNNSDRRIKDYARGERALLEGERIHEEMRNFEHDLWSY